MRSEVRPSTPAHGRIAIIFPGAFSVAVRIPAIPTALWRFQAATSCARSPSAPRLSAASVRFHRLLHKTKNPRSPADSFAWMGVEECAKVAGGAVPLNIRATFMFLSYHGRSGHTGQILNSKKEDTVWCLSRSYSIFLISLCYQSNACIQ